MKRLILATAAIAALSAAAFMLLAVDSAEEHGGRMALEQSIAAALNKPDGPDYVEAIRLQQGSDQPAAAKALDVNAMILTACERGLPPCSRERPATASRALSVIAGVARTAEEPDDRTAAARILADSFTNGIAGVLPADPPRAECWRAMSEGATRACR